MFTGIVETCGSIKAIASSGRFATISVATKTITTDLKVGESVAVNGVCLTVIKVNKQDFSAELSDETLAKTSLRHLKTGSLINLERALPANGRFGGHLVQGHVDAVGLIDKLLVSQDFCKLQIKVPLELAKYLVVKGSIAVDGISLTIARLIKTNLIEIAVIPHTYQNTNLRALIRGSTVNLEFDILAKYVERLLELKAI